MKTSDFVEREISDEECQSFVDLDALAREAGEQTLVSLEPKAGPFRRVDGRVIGIDMGPLVDGSFDRPQTWRVFVAPVYAHPRDGSCLFEVSEGPIIVRPGQIVEVVELERVTNGRRI